MIDFYEILGIPTNATSMDIEKAIRLARQRGDVDEKILSQARNYLIDPKMRKVYDKKMGINAASRARPRSALKSDTPFWIPVLVIVIILVLGMVGMFYLRKDANEKRVEAEIRQSQEQTKQRERMTDGGNDGADVQARVNDWHQSQINVTHDEAHGAEYMLTTKKRLSESSVFKEMKLVLFLPQGDQAQLVMYADEPVSCSGECRIQLVFDADNRYSLPAQAGNQYWITPISDSAVDAFRQDGTVSVTLPDTDHSQFQFTYKGLRQ